MPGLLVWFGLVVLVVGLTGFAMHKRHFLSTLLYMEIMTQGLYCALLGASVSGSLYSYICLVFITVGVCEAAIGLCLLVVVVRNWGNDYLSSFSMTKY